MVPSEAHVQYMQKLYREREIYFILLAASFLFEKVCRIKILANAPILI